MQIAKEESDCGSNYLEVIFLLKLKHSKISYMSYHAENPETEENIVLFFAHQFDKGSYLNLKINTKSNSGLV